MPAESTSAAQYDGTLKGFSSKATHYHRYLLPSGELTGFQHKKVEESFNLQRVKSTSSRKLKNARIKLTEEEENILSEMTKELRVNAKFFFELEVRTSYSLRMLYRCRCRQLDVPIDSSIDLQLSPCCSPDSYRSVVSIDCSRTYLGKRGVLALVSVIVLCTELTSLLLPQVGIRGSEEAALHLTALLEGLTLCPNLQVLDLSCNRISDHFGLLILEMISSLPLLFDVRLHQTGLNELILKKIRSILDARNEEMKSGILHC